MFSLRNRSIVAKIGIVIGGFTLLVCALVGGAGYSIRLNDTTVQTVLGDQSKSLYLASIAAEQKTHIHQRAFEVVVESDSKRWAELQKAYVDEASGLEKSLSDLAPMMDEGDLKFFDPIKGLFIKYRALELKVYDMRRNGQRDAAEDLLQGEMTDLFAKLDMNFDGLVAKQKSDMEAASQTIHDVSQTTLFAMVGTGLIGLLLVAAGSMILVKQQIAGPVTRMAEIMRELAFGNQSVAVPSLGQKDEVGTMASAVQSFKEAAVEKIRVEAEAAHAREAADRERQRNTDAQAEAARQQAHVVSQIAAGLEHLSDGDLLFRLEQPFAADYDKLRTDFNGAIAKLKNTMTVISGSTLAIRSGTAEISTAAGDLSRRTEQQAASLEETAAALDEITATVKKTATGASHANAVVSTAKSDAERSGEVVGRAVQAMTAIEASSHQISQIIGVIDEIAFQTNLLALNAGVEAARAGEAGRGFAVVASEVRALAQRSAEAAKEIKALILTSAGQVNDGVELVGETGKALERIVLTVTEISTIVTEIAASAQEQSAGLEQVNTAINQMDQVTQQNAAMVEESTAASRNLAIETEELSRLVGQFQVGAGGTRGTALTRPVADARPGSRPVTALKTSGQSAAVRKPEPQDASWEEF